MRLARCRRLLRLATQSRVATSPYSALEQTATAQHHRLLAHAPTALPPAHAAAPAVVLVPANTDTVESAACTEGQAELGEPLASKPRKPPSALPLQRGTDCLCSWPGKVMRWSRLTSATTPATPVAASTAVVLPTQSSSAASSTACRVCSRASSMAATLTTVVAVAVPAGGGVGGRDTELGIVLCTAATARRVVLASSGGALLQGSARWASGPAGALSPTAPRACRALKEASSARSKLDAGWRPMMCASASISGWGSGAQVRGQTWQWEVAECQPSRCLGAQRRLWCPA